MGYAALLFCPDDKTARTVTQVLSELEFAVEACTEPFAAVKKLMSQHFDAVVVDCDNEQNATLVFKSARNSTSNQTSLAVAVVEGQAGVAKAFRIGANLVLTKPINIEQAKGTVRVARGLLRKGEPAKPGAVATSAAAPSKPASRPVTEAQIAEASPSTSPLAPEAPMFRPQTPVPAAFPTAVARSKPAAHDDDLLGIEGDAPQKAPAAPAFQAKSAPSVSAQPMMGSAASAAAPARDRREWDLFEKPASTTPVANVAEKTVEVTKTEAQGIVGSVPSFTFGGAAAEDESEGGSKKIFLGIAAALIVAGGIYFGWSHIRGSADQPAPANAISSPSPTPTTNGTQPATKEPVKGQPGKPSASLPSAPEGMPLGSSDAKHHKDENAPEDDLNSEPTTSSNDDTEKPEPAPLIVKGGQGASRPKGGSEAAPPSVIGLATPAAGAPPADLIPTPTPSLRPTLQTLNISQGVSQGLLIKKVAPVYPQTALRMRIEGSVELVATISKTGEITHVKVVSGDAQLSKAAVDAVKQWKYKPYLLNGEPVEIQTQVTVNFKLPR